MDLIKIIEQIESAEPTENVIHDNLTCEERTALQQLNTTRDFIIKKADKGNELIILDTEYYRDILVLRDHLSNANTYQVVDSNTDFQVVKDLKTLMEKHHCLTRK